LEENPNIPIPIPIAVQLIQPWLRISGSACSHHEEAGGCRCRVQFGFQFQTQASEWEAT